MAMQLIICVEADKRSGTDNIYIKETLDRFYNIGFDVNINYINMGGKSKYKAKDVTRKINQYKRDFKLGETVVIICVDTDQFEKDINHKREFDDVSLYAAQEGYDLVWFCHDVEEVYIGKSIVKDAKKNRAIEFKKKKEIEAIDEKKIASNRIYNCTSNILAVFDKYLGRK